MSRAVWKYVVPVDDREHTFGMPLYSKPVHVACQRVDEVCIWAYVDTSARTVEDRTFRVFGTGQPVDVPVHRHVGTALAADGALVWHVFEVLNGGQAIPKSTRTHEYEEGL